jgi:amino acid adenylation domain-containing protein
MILQQRISTSNTASFTDLFSDKIYWLNQLSSELSETNLIIDYARTDLNSSKDKVVTFELPTNSSSAIANFSNHSEFSVFLLLLAIFKILLKKYTGNNDLVLGAPIYHKIAQSTACDRQILPLRTLVSDTTFTDFLLQVKDTAIAAYSHPNYPLDELIQLLELPHNQNRYPIFDIVILLENIHSNASLSELNNDLTVSFISDRQKISGKIIYKSSLFREQTIKLLAQHYVQIANCLVANDFQIKISDINFLNEIEQHQLLTFNSNFNSNYPVSRTLHNLFEQQVQRSPNRIAAVWQNVQLTYQELNEIANQLARHLRQLGVRRGEFVGILKQRDTNFLIAILAVLKVGGVYVPIDRTYPIDRISYILNHSEVKTLLTDSSCLNFLAQESISFKSVICLDCQPPDLKLEKVDISDCRDFQNLPKENLQESGEGIDPAYTIYTSGSTGLPKGTIIRHGGAINHIYAEFTALELTADFNFLQTAPASSDISVWQFLAPLLIGGRTVIVERETVADPEKLFQAIQQQQITLVEIVPVVLANLLDYISRLAPSQRALPHLQWMMVTGETVAVELVNRWLQLYPSIKVVNAYGPTEAADDIAQSIIDKPLPANQRTVPIGKPLANLTLYILGDRLQLVPVGIPGEICVAGFGVGMGYWKNARQTQLSFVPNPFPDSSQPLPGTDKNVIYRTGDLGRWLPDGNIEFLGRMDDRVKLRGFRIELGEIESLLAQHPAVRETVVILREDIPNNKQLVAYVVASNDTNSELVPQLRHFLQARLPDYMMPSAFVLLEALPLTPNDKVDRRALPAPDTPSHTNDFVSPRTPAEAKLANIWADVLAQKQVGIHNNFFELGGHSLLATQVISRLREEFQLELPLRSLFEAPTVAQLAERIEQVQTAQRLQTLGRQTPDAIAADEREEIEL